MREYPEAAEGAPMLGPLLKAVLDATSEGVVVFDRAGRVAYASASARGLMRGHSGDAGPTSQVLAHLLEHGGRRVPLRAGEQTLGEAVFIGAAARETNLAERERRAILETLRSTGWRLTAAARHLGISRTTLWRRLKAYGVHRAQASPHE